MTETPAQEPLSPPPADDAPAKRIVRYKGRRYGKRMGDDGGGSASWMVTFTDVMGLMLTFFVMLYAMSNPKVEEWENFTDTLQKNFNKFYGMAANRGFQESINIDKVDYSRALDLNYLRALIGALIEREGSLQSVALINQSGSLIMSLPQDLLFEAGSADVKPEGSKALYAIAEMLSRIKNRVEVVGHTDPRPIASAEFSSNWDLSSARAARVAAVLQDVGYTEPVTIRGMAAGRYADLPEGLSEEEKLSISRRVDIVIMEDDGKRVKLFDIGLP